MFGFAPVSLLHVRVVMRIALIAPPFIEVPPIRYGGTELFIGNLACELQSRGHDVTVYANGDSKVPCRVKWHLSAFGVAARRSDAAWHSRTSTTPRGRWTTRRNGRTSFISTTSSAFRSRRFISTPTVLTIHHPHEPSLSEQYARYPDVHYVAIAHWLAERSRCRRCTWCITASVDRSLRVFVEQGRLRRVPRAHGAVQRTAPRDRGGAAGGRSSQAGGRGPADLSGLLGRAGRSAHRRRADRIRRRSRSPQEERAARRSARAALPDSVGRAVRPRDDRSDGVRHAGARVCPVGAWKKSCATA